jgi:hypothetical protein
VDSGTDPRCKDATAKVEVREAGTMGLGLFAKETISKGMVVAYMTQPKKMVPRDWEEYAKQHGLPEDAGIKWERKSIVFVDGDFTTQDKPPLWYRANNRDACMSNCEILIDEGEKVVSMKWTICLVTRHVVPARDQLMWSYNSSKNLPRDWT